MKQSSFHIPIKKKLLPYPNKTQIIYKLEVSRKNINAFKENRFLGFKHSSVYLDISF